MKCENVFQWQLSSLLIKMRDLRALQLPVKWSMVRYSDSQHAYLAFLHLLPQPHQFLHFLKCHSVFKTLFVLICSSSFIIRLNTVTAVWFPCFTFVAVMYVYILQWCQFWIKPVHCFLTFMVVKKILNWLNVNTLQL